MPHVKMHAEVDVNPFTRPRRMERLFEYFRKLFFDRFTGRVMVNVVNGKVAHVETTTRKVMEFKELPDKGDKNNKTIGKREKLSLRGAILEIISACDVVISSNI